MRSLWLAIRLSVKERRGGESIGNFMWEHQVEVMREKQASSIFMQYSFRACGSGSITGYRTEACGICGGKVENE